MTDIESTDGKSIIVKVPKVQTKKGIFDLIFETQLQMYLTKTLSEYLFTVREEVFEMSDTRLLNYFVIEERESHQNLYEFITKLKS
jgi:hypothetical protein